jgi:hypothetical protein
MATAKIDIKIGRVSFAGEGDDKWIAAQLDKILEKAGSVPATPEDDQDVDGNGDGGGAGDAKSAGTLAKFLEKHKATSNHARRFLATAEWLTLKGAKKHSTKTVVKALKDSHQSRLTNPAICLARNISRGLCEKDGSEFFVTPEGRASLKE